MEAMKMKLFFVVVIAMMMMMTTSCVSAVEAPAPSPTSDSTTLFFPTTIVSLVALAFGNFKMNEDKKIEKGEKSIFFSSYLVERRKWEEEGKSSGSHHFLFLSRKNILENNRSLSESESIVTPIQYLHFSRLHFSNVLRKFG
ncbi:hypothetical protein Lal_00040369 [Lupinus albus]|nr:hypothetical protein Lal_00040369 [Lupinus albus]